MSGHHITPRSYLERFARRRKPSAETGHLWVYSNDAPVREGTARSEGAENGYFTIRTKSGQSDDSFEQRLAVIEGECNPVLKMAPNPCFVWSNLHRERMARYCALLHSRARAGQYSFGFTSKRSLDALKDLAEDMGFIEEITEHYETLGGIPLQRSAIKAAVLEAARSLSAPEETKRGFLDQILFNTHVISSALLKKRWQLWTAPDETEFIASDSPLVTVMPINGLFAPGYGFDKPGVLVFFPLRPSDCLVMGEHPGYPRRGISPELVDKVNRSLAWSATRYIYARSHSAELETMIRENGFQLKPGVNSFLLPGDWRPILREFLRHKLGVRPRPSGASSGP
jgi:hypothetical protein